MKPGDRGISHISGGLKGRRNPGRRHSPLPVSARDFVGLTAFSHGFPRNRLLGRTSNETGDRIATFMATRDAHPSLLGATRNRPVDWISI